MKKRFNWGYVFLIAIVIMFLLGVYGDIIWDKSDWIFLVLVLGIIMLNVKLNKIIKLLSKR